MEEFNLNYMNNFFTSKKNISSHPIVIRIVFVLLYILLVATYSSKAEAFNCDQRKGKIYSPDQYGAIGNGVSDDSIAVQKALTRCSKENAVCVFTKNKEYFINTPLFVWGRASICGDDSGSSQIKVGKDAGKYVLNFGLKEKHILGHIYSGQIKNISFSAQEGRGRLLYFWNTSGAIIENNIFDFGNSGYSATSSGNDYYWFNGNSKKLVRENITIRNNSINANSDKYGSEGFGLSLFDNVIIENNHIYGTGDDPIGIHVCQNVKIIGNKLYSVDGRIFVSNSSGVEIKNNFHSRIKTSDKFERGISLIYAGYETSNNIKYPKPSKITIEDNKLTYPKGAIDNGAAIYVYGADRVEIIHNTIINNSRTVNASGLHILPLDIKKRKFNNNYGKIGNIKITGNKFIGKYPSIARMTGNCNRYYGSVKIFDNEALGYSFYCKNAVMKNNSVLMPVFF